VAALLSARPLYLLFSVKKNTARNNELIQALKPGVSKGVHLFIAPMLWSVIGVVLMFRGWGWIGSGRARLLVLVALALGTAKSLFVLDKTSRRLMTRIHTFEGATCLGAVYSWKTWLLVLLMMGSGIALRRFTDPGMVIGTIYMAIGWALFFSSRRGWQGWWQWVHGD
jgi:cytochrome b